MKRKNIIISFVIGAIFVAYAFTSLSYADTAENGKFYVHPIIPKNQIDKNVSYFDLKMKPEEKQVLKVKIYNEKSQDIQVSVGANNASTNSNGLIDYTVPGIKDQSMKYSFECLAEVDSKVVTVPALGSTIAKVEVNMPEEKFDGIILGGLNFTEVTDEVENEKSTKENNKDKEENKISIENKISYVVAVRLSETDKVLGPQFNLFDVKAQNVDYTPALTHYIRNDEAALKTKMKMTIDVKDSGGTNVYKETANDVSIAPNSVLPYAMKLNDGELAEGSYTSHVKITYIDNNEKEQVEEMALPFKVTNQEIEKIEGSIPSSDSVPLWAKILISLIAVLILTIIVMIVIISKRKKNGPAITK